MKNIPAAGASVTWGHATGDTWTVPDFLQSKTAEILGNNWWSSMKIKRTSDLGSQDWKIDIAANGTVTRTVEPISNTIS